MRSVRVAVPRFGVDSLTHHANERTKKKQNPEFKNKRASKLSYSFWMRDWKTSGKGAVLTKDCKTNAFTIPESRSRNNASEDGRPKQRKQGKQTREKQPPHPPTHPPTPIHPHPEKTHPAGKDTNAQKKESGHEAAHTHWPPRRKDETQKIAS